MPNKSGPINFRLTEDAVAAIAEAVELSGLKRSAVIETAVREYRDRLRDRRRRARDGVAEPMGRRK